MSFIAEYGEQTPEHFDRFGVGHHVTVTTPDHGKRIYLTLNPRGIVRRLGLTLQGWAKYWPGAHRYCLDVHGRPLEIRRYADGRIKLWLDGQPVYTENTKVVIRHGIKRREVEKWYDPAVDIEEREAAREERLEKVRRQLGTL